MLVNSSSWHAISICPNYGPHSVQIHIASSWILSGNWTVSPLFFAYAHRPKFMCQPGMDIQGQGRRGWCAAACNVPVYNSVASVLFLGSAIQICFSICLSLYTWRYLSRGWTVFCLGCCSCILHCITCIQQSAGLNDQGTSPAIQWFFDLPWSGQRLWPSPFTILHLLFNKCSSCSVLKELPPCHGLLIFFCFL